MENLYAKSSSHMRTPVARIVSGITCLLLVVGAMLLSGRPAFAQSYSKVDVNFYGFTLIVPDVTLMKGESVEVKLLVGNAANPVYNAIGFDLAIEIAPNARLAPSLVPSMSDSWLAEPNKSVSESHTQAFPQRYLYRFSRTTAVDDGGILLQVTIIAEEDYARSTELIRNVAGVMQIDNLDLKHAMPSPAPSASDDRGHGIDLSVWPNPAVGSAKSSIHLLLAHNDVTAVTIMNLEGRVLASYAAVDAIDMSGYPAGTYLLQVTDQTGQVHYCRQNLF